MCLRSDLWVYLVDSESHWLLCFPYTYLFAFMSVLNTGSIPRVMLGLGEKNRNKAQFSASGSVFKELENYGQAWIGR